MGFISFKETSKEQEELFKKAHDKAAEIVEEAIEHLLPSEISVWFGTVEPEKIKTELSRIYKHIKENDFIYDMSLSSRFQLSEELFIFFHKTSQDTKKIICPWKGIFYKSDSLIKISYSLIHICAYSNSIYENIYFDDRYGAKFIASDHNEAFKSARNYRYLCEDYSQKG